MKLITTFFLFLISTPLMCQTVESELSRYKEVDNELNKVYKQLIKEYSYDTLFIDKIKVAQRNWLKYRDSELDMMYPKYQFPTTNKPIENCMYRYLIQLTELRTEKLRQWLTGTENFEECSGSIFSRANDGESPAKLIVDKEFLNLYARMQTNHHFFGYESPDFSSEKLLLFSVGTSPVENNYKKCKYGAYYDTHGKFSYDMHYSLKYISEEKQFIKSILIENLGTDSERVIDVVYFDKKWVEQ